MAITCSDTLRKHQTVRILVSALAFACSLALTSSRPALADDDLGTLQDLLPPTTSQPSVRSQSGRVRIFDNFLIHPLPVWSSFASGPAPAERSRIQTGTRNGVYQLRMVPQDEAFDTWKSLFSVVGHNSPVRSLAQHGNIVVQQFRTICSPTNTSVFRVSSSPTRIIQLVACGNYSRDRSVGHMAAIVTLQNASGLVTISRQWRTGSFQSRIESDWPIEKIEIDRVLVELSRARLVPLKSDNG